MPTMQSGSVRVLAIQELVDIIIDHVAQLAECSTGDLFCCALVAKPWVYRAQTHIFAHLDLSLTCYCSPASNAKCNSSLSSPDSERSTSSACAAVLSHKLHRLQNTLHTSPHLVRFVRRLSVPLNSVLLPSVALIPFTHLEDFTLECTSYPWAPCAPPSATHPIQTLLRHPRLRRVTLWGYLEPFSLIDTYFTNCARGIREVRLRLDNLNAYPDGCVTSPDGNAAVGGKIPLTHLSAPRELCGWLTTGRCPFEFSELRSLEVRAADWTALKPVFAPAFPLLQSLTLAPFTSEKSVVALGALPALQRLGVRVTEGSDAVQALPQLLTDITPVSKLRHLAIHFEGEALPDESALREFDRCTAALRVPQPRIQIYIPPEHVDALRSHLPGLVWMDRVDVFEE